MSEYETALRIEEAEPVGECPECGPVAGDDVDYNVLWLLVEWLVWSYPISRGWIVPPVEFREVDNA